MLICTYKDLSIKWHLITSIFIIFHSVLLCESIMFELNITPRFSETDALGHISNISYNIWFEHARTPIFKFFTPDLDPTKWQLILASTSIDFKAQAYLGHDIIIHTSIFKIGNSSFQVEHTAYQAQKLIATGIATMINFNYSLQKSEPIPDSIRKLLQTSLNNS